MRSKVLLYVVVLTVTALVAPAAQPRYGGTLTIAMEYDAATLDPLAMTDVASGNVFVHITEALFDLTPEGDIVPLLATGYAASEDGLVWTIYLRKGVRFHDGTPFNAEAAKINLDRFRTRATFRFLIDAINEVTVVDDHTVRLLLSRPFAPLVRGLAHTFTGMLSPAAIEAAGGASPEKPIGTGPFKFVEWVRGDRLVLERNPNYWGEGPYLHRVVFKPVPEPGTRVMMLLTGEADVITVVPPDDVRVVQAHPDCRMVFVPSLLMQYVGMNNLRPPFNDVRVRQAINYAIDKQEIIDYVRGGYDLIADAPIGPRVFGYHPAGPYDYDPERARQLLAEAGYPHGFTTTLRYNPGWREMAAEVIQAQLRKVGIDAKLIRMEWAAYLAFTARPPAESEVDMFMLGWTTVTGDADYGLYALFHSDEWAPRSNRVFYSNKRVDELLDRARAELDPAVRKRLYAEAIEIIWAEAPWAFLFFPTNLQAARTNVEGMVFHPNLYVLARTAWKR